MLPPELARFAEEAVAAGRFPDASAVVAAGVSLLQRQEQARAAFNASRFPRRAAGNPTGCGRDCPLIAELQARRR